ncbi:unnamed protein product [Pneumocystis jirovecii]|uniref:Uncharacterized protein n=2 Tax=Pneumocystis jirovecii TaxID=42068 RepID=L0PHK1_PNEJI|nr:uncharacterized protein T551_02504 [Pneumocystis jirovecii RU7]KTW28654.1 hypothetical protein T551_02504 [Pneumocystis jirovecii RU7]CCJ31140.1 unnamed protein product [Pneumocystis jirovecii]
MDPLISWILFLGISGTVYIALRGMPSLGFSMNDKAASGRADGTSFSKRIRKRRRIDRAVDEVREVRLEQCEQREQRIHKAEKPQQAAEPRIDKAEPRIYRLEQTEQVLLHPTDASVSTSVHVPANASFTTSFGSRKTESLLATPTKKQKQNALKREKQKLVKARMEEERLQNLFQHQKMLEEERQRTLAHKRLSKPNTHAWLPRAVSDEWTVVGARGARHASSVASTMT